MTLEELKAQLQTQVNAAVADVGAKQAALKQAENNLSFLQGQLHALNMINIAEPVYSNGAEEPPV